MAQSNIAYPYVVADIGGTNSRFALVTSVDRRNKQFLIENQQTYPSVEFNGIDQAVTRYMDSLNDRQIKHACLAVAGPVGGDEFKLTNLDWNISLSNTKNNLGLSNLLIINDFAAYAYAIQYLNKECFRTISSGKAMDDAPVAVLGPGTGFGVAMLVKQNGRVKALALEGGHMSLATNTALQSAIKEFMSRRFDRVTIKRVFSGPGLRYLYQALAAVEGTEPRKLSTAEISQHALDGSDEMCVRTLNLFCSWLGAMTGDLAMVLGARGGIYLGGGILPRIADFLITSEFLTSFKAENHMSHYLADIPIQLVTEGNSALLGAAAWFEDYAD